MLLLAGIYAGKEAGVVKLLERPLFVTGIHATGEAWLVQYCYCEVAVYCWSPCCRRVLLLVRPLLIAGVHAAIEGGVVLLLLRPLLVAGIYAEIEAGVVGVVLLLSRPRLIAGVHAAG